MSDLVEYELQGSVATIRMDDGKVNALSPRMLGELDAAFDRAARDRAVVVLCGREGIFSAGFDLSVLKGGGDDAVPMLQAGFRLAEKMLSFPTPVVAACTGHAIAMGVFLLLSADYRVGASGPFKIVANEVAIGLTMPRAAVEICRQRIAPSFFTRVVLLAETFSPEEAVTAGFLDRAVEPADVHRVTRELAEQFAALDPVAHVGSKLRARDETLHALRAAIAADDGELEALTAAG